MDYTVHGILQARILEWVAFSFSRGSSQPRDQTQVSHIEGRFFTSRATRKPKCTSNKIYINRSKVKKKKKKKARMAILISVKEISTNFKHILTCLILWTPWTVARQAPLSSTISQSLLKLMSIQSLMLSNHFILCCSFLFLPSNLS